MRTTVLVVAYRGDRWLPACLRTLAAASEAPLHLVLVDNAENTVLDALDLSAFEAEVLSTPRPMGFAAANNFALMEASCLGEAVLFLNQDTKSPPGWIDVCRRALAGAPRLGAVSPFIRTYADDGWDPSFWACLSAAQHARVEAGDLEEAVLPVPSAPAPALLVRTAVLRATGPFDPVYGSYYEDYDLCRRIRGVGHSVGVCPGARVRHFSGGATVTEAQQRHRMRQVLRNRILYRLRTAARPRWQAALGWFLADFPRRLARGLVGTPSSQPPAVTLQAYGDLVRLGRRVVSAAYDGAQWRAYLQRLGWPPASIGDGALPNDSPNDSSSSSPVASS